MNKPCKWCHRWMRVPLLCLLAACTAGSHAQVPGSYDTTFGSTNGYLPALAIGSNDSDRATALALQPDGKIVMAGTCSATLGSRMCLARLLPDGTLDASFVGPNSTPGNGKFLMTVAGSLAAEVSTMVLQPDGKILVAGTCSDRFCIARLNENGTFDTTFIGPAGTSSGDFSFSISVAAKDTLYGMALQADGKIVLAGRCDDGSGNSNNGQFCVARLNADGSFDATFDGPVVPSPGNGKFLIPRLLATSYAEVAKAVAVRPSGKILVAGSCYGTAQPCVAQLNANGTLDSSFDGSAGGNGKVVYPTFGGSGAINDLRFVLLQPDGHAVLGGTSGSGFAARITPTGTLDTTFGGTTGGAAYPPGSVQLPVNAGSGAIQPDGKLVLASVGNLVARLHSDGTADQSFDGPPPTNGDGVVALAYAVDGSPAIRAVAVQPDGKIIAAGYCDGTAGAGTSYRFCVARLHGGPNAARNCSPDIDGDGRMTATIDALITTRVMLGLTGSAVIGGITFPANAQRNSWSEIRDYLVSHCGMTIAP